MGFHVNFQECSEMFVESKPGIQGLVVGVPIPNHEALKMKLRNKITNSGSARSLLKTYVQAQGRNPVSCGLVLFRMTGLVLFVYDA